MGIYRIFHPYIYNRQIEIKDVIFQTTRLAAYIIRHSQGLFRGCYHMTPRLMSETPCRLPGTLSSRFDMNWLCGVIFDLVF